MILSSAVLELLVILLTKGILPARWFAERCDRIILLFDINKLDISDELKGAIDMVKGERVDTLIVPGLVHSLKWWPYIEAVLN